MLRRSLTAAMRLTRVLRTAASELAPGGVELPDLPLDSAAVQPPAGRAEVSPAYAEALLANVVHGESKSPPTVRKHDTFRYDVSSKTFAPGGDIAVPYPTPEWGAPDVEPMVGTALPGPRAAEVMGDLKATGGCGGAVNFIIDTERSMGNYVCDADGNIFLDCFGNIASLPLGYNHPDATAASQHPDWVLATTHRACLGSMPPIEYSRQCKRMVTEMAPKGLSCIQTMLCGSSSNENAFKAACIAYRQRQREAEGRTGFSEEETRSAMVNESPGAPDLAILSFQGAFHGRTLGCVSVTRSKPIHKLDVPQFDWPAAPFPRLEYPLAENEEKNRAEEERCLAATEDVIVAQKAAGKDVAAVIVEPIQAEGGDNHATPHFFRRLREITKKHGVFFIVDEVQTGVGASGKMWAHEAWGLPEDSPPDFVTFAKKAQTGGYFFRKELRPAQPYRIFNTWMGDPAKMAHLMLVLDVIQRDRLIERAAVSGALMLGGLEAIQAAMPELLCRARGQGTLIAVDAATPNQRDRIAGAMRRRGLLAGVCGDRAIRFRPALTFGPQHVEQALRIFAESAEEVAQS